MTVASQSHSESPLSSGAVRASAVSAIDLSYSTSERLQLSFLRVWDKMFQFREGVTATLAGGVLMIGLVFLVIAAYRYKSAMGIDLFPGIHASDIVGRF